MSVLITCMYSVLGATTTWMNKCTEDKFLSIDSFHSLSEEYSLHAEIQKYKVQLLYRQKWIFRHNRMKFRFCGSCRSTCVGFCATSYQWLTGRKPINRKPAIHTSLVPSTVKFSTLWPLSIVKSVYVKSHTNNRISSLNATKCTCTQVLLKTNFVV